MHMYTYIQVCESIATIDFFGKWKAKWKLHSVIHYLYQNNNNSNDLREHSILLPLEKRAGLFHFYKFGSEWILFRHEERV